MRTKSLAKTFSITKVPAAEYLWTQVCIEAFLGFNRSGALIMSESRWELLHETLSQITGNKRLKFAVGSSKTQLEDPALTNLEVFVVNRQLKKSEKPS